MKKLITIGVLAIAATTAFSQGYFKLSSGKSQTFDGFTTPGAAGVSANVDVALFWAAANTTPTVDSLLTSTPTAGNSSTVESYTVAQAWTAILNGQFAEATSTSIGGPVQGPTSTTGVVKFAGGSSFDIVGASISTAYTFYLVSWSAAFANPTAAQAGGSAVGWSAPFQYTVGTGPTDNSVTSPTIGQFGTFAPAVTVVPEPGTMALAGLGGLSLLAFRRKK